MSYAVYVFYSSLFVCLLYLLYKKDRNKILTIFKKDMKNYVTSIAYVYKLYSMCRIMVDYLHTPHNLLQHQRGIVVTLIFIALNEQQLNDSQTDVEL